MKGVIPIYNPLLKTLITVVDCGSFNKAAAKLYISPTAIIKQINSLESRLKLKLITRTSTGVRLTVAGNMIYQSAKFMKHFLLIGNTAFHVACCTATMPPADVLRFVECVKNLSEKKMQQL